MRIIAGKYRGRRLKSPAGLSTRPTSDRLRETLFNVLAPQIENASFLDLCAGTGAVGIEALSRGAVHVTFVEQSRRMCSLIETNLNALQAGRDTTAVVADEATAFLRKQAKTPKPSLARASRPFHIIFFDPPYAADYEAVLSLIGAPETPVLATGGTLVVEHHKKRNLPDEFGSLRHYRTLKVGDSILTFYRNTSSA